MKTTAFLMTLFIIGLIHNVNGQIKVHSDNWISIGDIDKAYGIQVEPSGYTYFSPSIFTTHAWMNKTYCKNTDQGCWIVQLDTSHTFYVQSQGDAWGRNFNRLSDSTIKTDIKDIPTPLKKVLKLHGVSFKYKERKNDTLQYTDVNGTEHFVNKLSDEDEYNPKYVNPKAVDSLKSEKKRKYYGVISQEVERVVPEVVRTRDDGLKVVNYDGIIGLLIEAIKEQQREIEELKETINGQYEFSQKSVNNSSFKSNDVEDASIGDSNVLFQNVPNPFSQSTVISFKLKSNSKKALITIYNLYGTLIKSYSISSPQVMQIEILGNELNPGMYLYCLIVDGKEIETRRMILTE